MKNHAVLGISLSLISALIYAIQTALIKYLGVQISVPVLVFVQAVVCFVLISVVIVSQGKQQAVRLLHTTHPIIHLFRTIFSLSISYLLFYSVQFIPLVDAVLLTNTAPLWVPLLSFVFMSKKINHKLWPALIIGFIGIILVLNPDKQVFHGASLLALTAGICMASSAMLIGEAKNDKSLTNMFYYFLFSLPISAIGAAIFWTPLSNSMWLILIGIGALFFLVQFSLSYALKFISVQTFASLYLSNIIFAAIIGIIIWHHSTTLLMCIGITLTVLGAILTIRMQNQTTQSIIPKAATHEQ